MVSLMLRKLSNDNGECGWRFSHRRRSHWRALCYRRLRCVVYLSHDSWSPSSHLYHSHLLLHIHRLLPFCHLLRKVMVEVYICNLFCFSYGYVTCSFLFFKEKMAQEIQFQVKRTDFDAILGRVRKYFILLICIIGSLEF